MSMAASEEDFLDRDDGPPPAAVDLADTAAPLAPEPDDHDPDAGDDAPAGAAPAADTPETDGADGEAGQPRNADGTFAPKAAASPETPAAAPVAPGTPPAADAEPPTLKVGGREVALDGAVRHEDGALTIRPDQVDAYLGVLRDGIHHRTTFREQLQEVRTHAQQEVQTARQELAAAQTEAKRAAALLEQLDTVISTVIGTPEAAQRFAQNYDTERALLVERLRNAELTVATTIQPVAPPTPSPAEDPVAVVEQVAQYAGQIIREEFDGLFGDDEARVVAKYLDAAAARYITTADRDVPEAGIRKGDPAIDLAALHAYLTSVAAPLQRRRDQVSAAERAAAHNAASPARRHTQVPSSSPGAPATAAARPAIPPASAPPTLTASAASPHAAPAPAGPPRTRAEWEAALARLSQSAADDDFAD